MQRRRTKAVAMLAVLAICPALRAQDPCSGIVIHVRAIAGSDTNDGSSWANAKETLQAALAVSGLGEDDCIWVAGRSQLEFGLTYPLDSDPNATFNIPSGLKLYGGFLVDTENQPTSVDDRGDCRFGECGPDRVVSYLEGGDVANHVLKAINCAEGTRIDGFWIQKGHAFGDSDIDPNDDDTAGGGLLVRGGHLVVDNCRFHYNNSSGPGGAIYVDNFVQPNEDDVPATLLVHRTTIEHSVSEGSDGGGIWNNAEYLELFHCQVIHNTATNGGGLHSGVDETSTNTVVLRNVLFNANKASVGAAIWNIGAGEASMELTNCTLYDNRGDTGTGGIYTEDDEAVVTILSSILWDNSNPLADPFPDQIVGGDVTADYSDIEVAGTATWPGTGNINAIPQVITSGNFVGRIQSNSPCINIGDPSGVAWDDDLDAGQRHVAGRIDMGVNEIVFGACCENEVCSFVAEDQCNHYICDLNEILGPYDGCYGDVDGNDVVNAADRGSVSAAIGQTAFHLICNFDMDGNGFINAADRGFISAEIGLCNPLPDWQNGSGENHGVFPDPRFPYFFGVDTVCEEVECEPESMMMGGGGSYSDSSEESGESASLWLSEASEGWYGLEVSGITIEGAVILGATDEDAAVFEAAGVTESVVDLSTMFASPIPAVLFGSGYTRHDMLTLDGLSTSGEICQVRPAEGATLRLEVYVWRTVNGAIETYAAAMTE